MTTQNRMMFIGIFFFRPVSEFPLTCCATVEQAHATFLTGIAVFKHCMKRKRYFAVTTLPFLAL